MSDLREQINGVTGGASPTPGDGGGATTPASSGGNQDVTSGGGDRPIENAVAEFNRKLKEQREQFQSQLRSTKDEILGAIRGSQGAAPSRPPGTPRPMSDYSVAELETLQANPQLTADQKQIIFSELTIRRARETTREEIGAYDRTQRLQGARAEANAEAMRLYPTLGEEASAFSQNVDAELTRRQAVNGKTPTEVLDAANAVARAMGVRPEDGRQRGFVAGGGGAPAPAAQANPLPDDVVANVSQRLQRALPAGKKFDTKVIQEQTAQIFKKFGG